jgi:hypothetical protein
MKRCVPLLLLLCACATVQPYKTTGTSSKTADATFQCAISYLTADGYDVEQIDRPSGFLQAKKVFRKPMQIVPTLYRAKVLVIDQGAPSLQVSMTTLRGQPGDYTVVETQPEARAFADALRKACTQ